MEQVAVQEVAVAVEEEVEAVVEVEEVTKLINYIYNN